MPIKFLKLLLLSAAIINSLFAQTKSETAKIIVSPNILVSRQDADLPHAESHLAVNPKDAKNLLGGAIAFTRDERGNTSKIYVSKDGGYSWTTVEFPELGGVDPQVGFGLNGTAYFYWLGSKSFFYRSTDGGTTWEKGGQATVFDHPQMTIDQTFGQHAGNIYISGMYGIREMGILRSKDDGKSFIGPLKIPNPRGIWLINLAPFVASDGTLFVPYVAWDDTNGKQITQTVIELIYSTDGGATFSEPVKIADTPFRRPPKTEKLEGTFARQSNYASFGADPKTNQLYVVWMNDDNGKTRVYFSTSKDKGKTWSAGRAIANNVPAWANQYQTHLTVNKDGTIGIMWYDTRDCQRQDCYNLYFTASTDKGETFLPARRVSSETSYPISAKNLTPFHGFAINGKEATEQRYRTAFGRWAQGGDYLGFAVDAEGNFRPFWIDSRSGVFQVYTTQIKVGDEEKLPEKMSEISVREKIALTFDPVIYDRNKQEAVLPLRLKNISRETIYAPLKLEIKNLKGWTLLLDGKENSASAVDFSESLGDFKFLPPNAVSEPVLLRLRFAGTANLPSFDFDVRGSAAKN